MFIYNVLSFILYIYNIDIIYYICIILNIDVNFCCAFS